ncbi:MAG: TrbI/VirB10 family protein [Victivallales bacterium]|nr:TrbI/VirB10 family protein [Victivallales bacterium]
MKFFRSPTGIILVAAIIIALYMGLEKVFKKKDELKVKMNQFVKEPLETVYTTPLSEIFPDRQEPESSPETKAAKKDTNPERPGKPEKLKENTVGRKSSRIVFRPDKRPQRDGDSSVKPYIPPIGLYTAKPSGIPPNPKNQSAPYGQLLRCELVQTVMTSNLQTPIIAMVTEPLWWNGKEVIPAGVIVHGLAASSPVRDRVGTGTKWVLVWPHRNEWNGKKLILNAIALACDKTENTWAKIDGSAGIKGDVISNEDQKRMYAYMASFISGLGEGMVSESEDTTGSTTTTTTGGTFADALGKAFEKSAGDISDQLFKELSQNLVYVEARAGTEFYLYITQDIYLSEAKKTQVIIQTNKKKSSRK